MRLFAAVVPPEEIGRQLQRRQQGLPGARWRNLDSLHVTLRFFGDITRPQAEDLDAELAAVRAAPLTLSLKGVGVFGEGEAVHAVWAGVHEDPGLRRLAGRCEAAARRAGLKAETRAYRPHVTRAYLRRPDPARVAAWVQGHNLLKSPPFEVSSFGLYSSVTGVDGGAYTLERAYPLEG